MDGELEVEIVFYVTSRIIKSVKVPIAELKQDREGLYDWDEIERLAALKGKAELKAEGVKYSNIELSESELVSHPEDFDYWI
jgi:hypothetical protein